MNGALPFIAAAALLALALGFLARRGKDMNLEQWTVGGRGFGAVFVFLLLAGEIYTTFTFLGGSGYAYGKGAPAYYILSYGTLAYVLSYFMLPPIWRYAKEHRLYSQSDFFVRKYDSPTLGIIVAIVDIVALDPLSCASVQGARYHRRGRRLWRDLLHRGDLDRRNCRRRLCDGLGRARLGLDCGRQGYLDPRHRHLPRHLPALSLLRRARTDVPRRSSRQSQDSPCCRRTAKACGGSPRPCCSRRLGFYMWPHSFGSIYTARSARVIRKNAIVLPLYQLILLFVFFVGFAATLQVPGLTGSNIDLALFKLSVKTFDPWFVGVIGATGVLTALVPGSMILMTAATLIANNLYRAARPVGRRSTECRCSQSSWCLWWRWLRCSSP